MTLFASRQLVQRIERAEAASLRTIVEQTSDTHFAVSFGSGVALYSGVGSPLNKVVALGFEPFTAADLVELEQRYFTRNAAVQLELSTLADPALTTLLAAHGYQLTGFENVLGRSLAELPTTPSPELEVRRARDDELASWVDTLTTGFLQLHGDEQAAAHDQFERTALEQVFRDMARSPALERWLAFRGGELAGAAGMSLADGITQLFGAATLPAQRRRGVQGALLAARLAAGQRRGSDLAVVTTQPGSQSQQNVERAGFSLLYARAVWLKLP
jgi:ribosomal protein S18 acetylase RimI-like enzyme